MNDNNYDIGYLKRYVRGELSPREMYAVERAAQQDPLLADLLSGMEKDPGAEQLPLLRQRIQERIQCKEKPFIRKISVWKTMAGAAALLICLGTGLYYFTRHENSDKPQLAQQLPGKNNADVQTEKKEPLITKSNEMSSQAEDPEGDPESAKSTDSRKTKTRVRPKARPDVPLDTARMLASASPKSGVVARTTPLLPGARRISISKPEIQGTVTDSQTGGALAGAVVAQRNGKINAHTDKSGQFSLTPLSNDSLVDVYAPGYERKTLNYLSKNNILVKLSPARQTPDGAAAGVASRKKAEPAEPLWGWKAFNNYVKEKTKKSADTGYVELAFYVDDAGYPIGIEVLKSGGEQLDTRATQILLAGPKWSRSPEIVTVPFRFGK